MHKVYFKTFGCSLNQSDTELMAGLLKKAGFQVVQNLIEAELVIVNSCTVKGPSESRLLKYLENLKKDYPTKKIIVSGCVAQTDPEKLDGYSLLGTSQITKVVEVVEETLHDNSVALLVKEKLPRLNLPKLRKSKIIAIIPICEGCLGDPCSYCKVKEARGSLRSYPAEDILEEVRSALREGCKEIWLTAQDTGCYGKDIKTNLPSLLEKIIEIPGDFKVRLGMLNPNFALEYLEDLLNIFHSEKMFQFIHIPVQAGNNNILKAMKRKYDAEEFYAVVKSLRKEFPNITIATDFIVGFPGETNPEYQDSVNMLLDLRPDVVNISKFWPRKNTPAAEMPNQVPGHERKRRSTIMTGIFNNIGKMQNERWLGWEGEVLIDEIGKDNTVVGRNFAYKPVVIPQKLELGSKAAVKIKKVTSFDLRA